jgi:hypothetical protein
MENLERISREAAKTGFVKAPEFGELVAGMTRYGVATEIAVANVQAIVDRQKDLFDDTLTGQLKEAAGLFRETAAVAYELSESGLIKFFKRINEELEKISKSKSLLELLARLISGTAVAGVEVQEALSPQKMLQKRLMEIVGIQEGVTETEKKFVAALKEMIDATSQMSSELETLVGMTQQVEPLQTKKIISTFTTTQGGYEDFDEANASYETAAENVALIIDGVRILIRDTKELAEANKQIPKDLEKAAKFFGVMSDSLRTEKIKEFGATIENLLRNQFITPGQAKEWADILTRQLDIAAQKPVTDIFKRQFSQFGIITKEFYDNLSDQRNLALEQDLIKLREYAQKFGVTIKGLTDTPVSVPVNFKPVQEGFDVAGAISSA